MQAVHFSRALKLYAVVALMTAACALPSREAAVPMPRLIDAVPRGLAATVDASPGITWLLFVDDLHVDFRNTGHLRTLLKTISSELMRDGDVFEIRSSGPSSLSIGLTTDRNLLDDAIRKTHGNALKPSDILHIGQQGVEPNEVRYRATLALSAAYEAMRSLEQGHDQRKAFIYISNGHSDFSVARLRDQLSELTRQARRSNVTIFAIDPRSFAGPPAWDPSVDSFEWRDYLTTTRNSLRVMSDETGGFALVDDQDLVEALGRISGAMRN